MSTVRMILFSLFVHLTILSCYVGIVHAVPCSRVPQGTGAGRSVPSGNFWIRISSGSNYYQPGRQYTISIERKNMIRNREGSKPKFIGFYLVVEQKSTPASEYAEEFSPTIHGKLALDESYQSLVRLSCGNVATHLMETPKSEIQVNWTAPEAGAGDLSFRATIIENRDIWYMDGIFLTLDLQEDLDAQDDIVSEVQEECCACNEAKYELSFEGLWSKHTHPKNFPNNVYLTRFGDIIGATHKIGSGFWSSGETASDGLKNVAETGQTQTLESELKTMSNNIRTIIKARGLVHPNITGKTFAVFRVDSENHLISFVSTILPSPDWFVGVSGLELCQSNCTWIENKVLELYPWDAGTRDGISYQSTDRIKIVELKNRELIRRITSEWPAHDDSPFYDANGAKMKPLARLTLSRQRLYEKNCTAEQSASDDCQVTDFGAWGECTGGACDGNGKQYRQRYYKYPDKATKCRRKLFETKTCTMRSCTHENEDSSVFRDPDCDAAVSYSAWGPCLPNCKKSAHEMGKRTRKLLFSSRKAMKECGLRSSRPRVQEEPCMIQSFCVGQNQVKGW